MMVKAKANRLVFVNRFFYPDISATSKMLSELAFELANNDYKITVITGLSAYDDPGKVFSKSETIGGVEIIRVCKNRFNRTNYLGRLIDLIRFYALLTVVLLKQVKQTDILICKTDPPLLIVLGALVKRIKHCRLISWNQDVFPEIAVSYFNNFILKFLYKFLRRIRTSALKRCDQVIVISDSMRSKLGELGISKVSVIENWSQSLDADLEKVSALKKSWQIDNQFVVAYSGNFGFVHDYGTIRQVIEKLKNDQQIKFLFIGSGKYSEALQKHVVANQINNVIFKPYQPGEKLAETLAVADIHLITFRADMEGLVYPSKFYGICSAARPILFIGNHSAELAERIDKYDCGECFAIDQPDQVVHYLRSIKTNSQKLVQQGTAARELFDKHYNFSCSLKQWIELIKLQMQ